MFAVLLLTVAALNLSLAARIGFGPHPQDWGFVDVREGAHMFWWLHYTIADTNHFTDRPLILWLQGGPGSSSTGYGNFEILGPFDLALNERNFTWIKTHNVLFVDNPVGTGFSYVDHNRYLSKDNQQISKDLIELLKGFYDALPEFKTVPLHIFGESYGGKMAIEFAYDLYMATTRGEIESNLVSVAMGDAWISPIDSTLSWAPYLLQLGFVDTDGFENINNYALRTERALNKGNFFLATDLWEQTEVVLVENTGGVDFYNVQYNTRHRNSDSNSKFKSIPLNPRLAAFDLMVNRIAPRLNFDDENEIEVDDAISLESMMRNNVHIALALPEHVLWGSQAGAVFDTLAGDFMKPVVEMVEHALNSTNLKVVVYSGQLDLICATPGTVEWINKMNWYGSNEYKEAPRNGIGINNILEGYERQYGNFSMYWINKAGHMAPLDNPRAMGHVLRKVTNFG